MTRIPNPNPQGRESAESESDPPGIRGIRIRSSRNPRNPNPLGQESTESESDPPGIRGIRICWARNPRNPNPQLGQEHPWSHGIRIRRARDHQRKQNPNRPKAGNVPGSTKGLLRLNNHPTMQTLLSTVCTDVLSPASRIITIVHDPPVPLLAPFSWPPSLPYLSCSSLGARRSPHISPVQLRLASS